MHLFDTHVHLDQQEFDADRDAVVDGALRAGVEGMVAVGIGAASSATCVALASRYPGVHAAVGIQPNYAAEARPDDWEHIAALAGAPGVVAIGETGLDRHWDFTPFELQRDYFDRHLRLAQQHGLPVIVHCREADDDVLAMLRQAVERRAIRGVMHAFGGDAAMADECLALGFLISFAGSVTYTNRKFEPLRAVAARIPADRLLVETDSPYLTPHPLRGRQKRNEPALLRHTVECVAALRGVSAEELAAQTTANARRLFGLE
jgi:TatD DNase family protein